MDMRGCRNARSFALAMLALFVTRVSGADLCVPVGTETRQAVGANVATLSFLSAWVARYPTSTLPARVTLSIGDNGPGIPPEDRDRIFDAFHSSKGHGGTGLGLAAAKKIISELNGVIEVESMVGEGTAFHVKLPAVHVRLADSDKTHGPGPS